MRPDPALPRAIAPGAPRPKVAVIGGGLAGIAAASTLGERGCAVTIFEPQPYLGGKIGAWKAQVDGEEQPVCHGFHAFFRHYYNLNAWLDRLGLRAEFRPIDDYLILDAEGRTLRFAGISTTPVLNLLGLAVRGLFRASDVVRAPTRDLMGIFLEYDEATTFARYDGMSLADFDRAARLPRGLKLAFRTFSRAFFAEEDRVSLAELVKSFHSYYLSHDHGLLYDHPVRDYEAALLAPIRRHLAASGVELRLGTAARAVSRDEGGFVVDGERFDKVVLAADPVGASAILEGLGAPVGRPRAGQRYAVLRVYVDRDLRPGLPVFVATDRVRLLDSVTLYHRFELEAADYVARKGGAVLELHSYAVPDALPDAEVRGALLEELVRFFPELAGLTVRGEVFQLRRDFTAFHVGLHDARPRTDSGVPGLYLAGDWVRLPFPAMLLEAAFSSGLLAANGVLGELGLAAEPVDAVPSRGIMAGMPEPPARARALSSRSS